MAGENQKNYKNGIEQKKFEKCLKIPKIKKKTKNWLEEFKALAKLFFKKMSKNTQKFRFRLTSKNYGIEQQDWTEKKNPKMAQIRKFQGKGPQIRKSAGTKCNLPQLPK